jgi:hypothetical protein
MILRSASPLALLQLFLRLHDIFGAKRRRASPPPEFAKVVSIPAVEVPKVKAREDGLNSLRLFQLRRCFMSCSCHVHVIHRMSFACDSFALFALVLRVFEDSFFGF